MFSRVAAPACIRNPLNSLYPFKIYRIPTKCHLGGRAEEILNRAVKGGVFGRRFALTALREGT